MHKKIKIVLVSIFFTNCLLTTKPLYAVSESIRAKLPEVRECANKTPGTSWKDCKSNCSDICNEIECAYDRGVCTGALIQLCCGEHPSDCK